MDGWSKVARGAGWITVALTVLAGCATPSTEPKPIQQTLSPLQRFVQADRDESGSLSRQEFEHAAPRLARYFHLIDLDTDGEASLDELMAAWQKYRARMQQAKGEVGFDASHGESLLRKADSTD